MMRSCCLFTIVKGFQERCFIGTDNRCRVLDNRDDGPVIVGRVRRSRHPATGAQD
ncbi:hypothetical protein ACJVQT_08445 [Enterobacter huaxiensis]|uniref:hypothetical protein n=1 Tax=Enterobacter huaxiensis TaxID=2494702 RepID=UPI0013150C59|nr:hypothetical protein [Enterobacter huaxiensis]